MKAVSVIQPFASLIVQGHKKIETKPRDTKHRGPLLIHASLTTFIGKGPYRLNCAKLCMEPPFYNLLDGLAGYNKLPFGAIIGQVNLIDTFPFDAVRGMIDNNMRCRIGGHLVEFTEQEVALGDYGSGRYGWLLSDPVIFVKPIPAKGQLGLWNFGAGTDLSYLIKK